MGTTVERWIAEGKAEGRREMLLRILEKRFGTVPKRIRAQLAQATPKRQEAALERLRDAERIDDIMKGGRAR